MVGGLLALFPWMWIGQRNKCHFPDKKVHTVAVASCSAAPPKAPRKKSSKKGKSSAGDTSSIIRPEKTKSLESRKRKHKASEGIFDAEIQAASSLAQLGQKKAKKAVKKIVVSTVRRVPSTFSDDEMIDELRPTGFSSCLWCDLRFNVRHSCTPGSENEFVNVETFSDDVLKVQEALTSSVVVDDDAKANPSRASTSEDKASPKFDKTLERTVQRSGDPVEDLPLIETHEELPEGQDPSPSVVAFNESFSASFTGELLNVSGEMLLWMVVLLSFPCYGSPLNLWMKQEREYRKKSRLTGETSSVAEKHPSVVEKHVSSPAQKSLMIYEPVNEIPLVKLNPAGSYISSIFFLLLWFLYIS
jgi:hypothetical protein